LAQEIADAQKHLRSGDESSAVTDQETFQLQQEVKRLEEALVNGRKILQKARLERELVETEQEAFQARIQAENAELKSLKEESQALSALLSSLSKEKTSLREQVHAREAEVLSLKKSRGTKFKAAPASTSGVKPIEKKPEVAPAAVSKSASHTPAISQDFEIDFGKGADSGADFGFDFGAAPSAAKNPAPAPIMEEMIFSAPASGPAKQPAAKPTAQVAPAAKDEFDFGAESGGGDAWADFGNAKGGFGEADGFSFDQPAAPVTAAPGSKRGPAGQPAAPAPAPAKAALSPNLEQRLRTDTQFNLNPFAVDNDNPWGGNQGTTDMSWMDDLPDNERKPSDGAKADTHMKVPAAAAGSFTPSSPNATTKSALGGGPATEDKLPLEKSPELSFMKVAGPMIPAARKREKKT
jgi:hypothetical protein